MSYPIPTNDERKRLFRLIRQYSSWTAWRFVGRYHKTFVDLLETAFNETQQRPAPDGKPLLETQEMALFLSGWASFDGALDKLRYGDKTVFKFIDYGISSAPYFCEAHRMLNTWVEGYLGGLFYARGIDARMDRHPMFAQLEAALRNLDDVWCRVALSLQSRHTDLPAPICAPNETIGNSTPMHCNLDYQFVPAAEVLDEVPVPADEVLIRTGESCPAYGIWEPVKTAARQGLLASLRSRSVAPDGRYEPDGCMNYLHQGAAAPRIAFDSDAPRGEGRPTVWRLIWKDDRYRNGTVPVEESTYRFDEPKNLPRVPPHREPVEDVSWRMTGQPATQKGIWASQDALHTRVVLNQGELLPARADGIHTVWVFVPGV